MFGGLFAGTFGGIGSGGGTLPGSLQLAGGGVMSVIPRAVTDNLGNSSTLDLSTGLVVMRSPVNIGVGTVTNNGLLTIKGVGGNIVSLRSSSDVELSSLNSFGTWSSGTYSVPGGIFSSNGGNGVLYNGSLSNPRVHLNTANINIEANANTALSASVLFGIQSTTKGFLPPVMTQGQFAAIGAKATGLMAYDTSNDAIAIQTATGGSIALVGNVIKSGSFGGGSGAAGVWRMGNTQAMPNNLFLANEADTQVAIQINNVPYYIVAKSGTPF